MGYGRKFSMVNVHAPRVQGSKPPTEPEGAAETNTEDQFSRNVPSLAKACVDVLTCDAPAEYLAAITTDPIIPLHLRSWVLRSSARLPRRAEPLALRRWAQQRERLLLMLLDVRAGFVAGSKASLSQASLRSLDVGLQRAYEAADLREEAHAQRWEQFADTWTRAMDERHDRRVFICYERGGW